MKGRRPHCEPARRPSLIAMAGQEALDHYDAALRESGGRGGADTLGRLVLVAVSNAEGTVGHRLSQSTLEVIAERLESVLAPLRRLAEVTPAPPAPASSRVPLSSRVPGSSRAPFATPEPPAAPTGAPEGARDIICLGLHTVAEMGSHDLEGVALVISETRAALGEPVTRAQAEYVIAVVTHMAAALRGLIAERDGEDPSDPPPAFPPVSSR